MSNSKRLRKAREGEVSHRPVVIIDGLDYVDVTGKMCPADLDVRDVKEALAPIGHSMGGIVTMKDGTERSWDIAPLPSWPMVEIGHESEKDPLDLKSFALTHGGYESAA